MTAWQPSQEKRAKQIRTLQDCHREFDMTFKDLVERTDVLTSLNAIALTVAARAHKTPDPAGAMEEFTTMLARCYEAVANDIKEGKWKTRPKQT